MLGKATTKAFILENAIKNSFKIDLSAYNMTENDFSLVTQQRASLMIKWYAKVSFPKLNILATSAIISNIGQILISKEIILNNKKSQFLEILEDSSISEAEIEIVGMDSEEVTANILRYWQFDETLITSIEYCSNSKVKQIDELNPDIRPYVLANYIIHQVIDGCGNIDEDKFENIKSFLDKNKMNSAVFFDSLEIIRKFFNHES
jgi:HD-like signal output (HDOD) protein